MITIQEDGARVNTDASAFEKVRKKYGTILSSITVPTGWGIIEKECGVFVKFGDMVLWPRDGFEKITVELDKPVDDYMCIIRNVWGEVQKEKEKTNKEAEKKEKRAKIKRLNKQDFLLLLSKYL